MPCMVVTNIGIELKLSVEVAEDYSSPAQRDPCDDGGVGQPCGALSQLWEGVESIW